MPNNTSIMQGTQATAIEKQNVDRIKNAVLGAQSSADDALSAASVAQGDVDGLSDTYAQMLEDTLMFGFVVDYAGTQQTTISFDEGTATFSISPTGESWQYYRNGVLCTVSGSKSAVVDAGNPQYIYIDSEDGELVRSTTSWTLEDTKVPVAIVSYRNAQNPKYMVSDERHTCSVSRRWHWEHHFADGTEIISAPSLDDYNVAPSTPTDADNQFSISGSSIADEDLKRTLAAVPAGGPYHIDYQASLGSWRWSGVATVPFRYTASGYINYDNAGTMTEGAANNYYVTYLLATNREGEAAYSIVHGQAEYATLAAARAANFSDLTLSGFTAVEFVAVYKFIWRAGASYGTLGKCRLEVEPEVISVAAIGTVGTTSVEHNSTLGLQGGATDEYYHLTAAETAKLVTNGDSHDHVGGDGAAITEAAITLADNTTNDVSTSAHGFVPKAPNDTSKALLGDGAWGSLPSVDVQTFTSNGTWTKPAGKTSTAIWLVGGGSGGGSGRRGAASSVRNGGSGGSGGGVSYVVLPTSILGATESVTVGSGGSGGAARTSNDTSGADGTAGAASLFGSWVQAKGGAAGKGGTNSTSDVAAGSGGDGSEVVGRNGGSSKASGAAGAAGQTATGKSCGGGGSGGGITTADAVNNGAAGSAGGACYGTTLTAGTAGTSGGNGGNGTSVNASIAWGGAGGGGGGASKTANAGAGGNGGTYGAGGGGGGASLNGYNSGKGGDGASGFVIVISW